MDALVVQSRLPMPVGVEVSAAQWRVLTDAIFPAARSPDSIALALDYCRARKLDIFKRPVSIVPMWNNQLRREVETIWPGINELQVTAARTGQWGGMDEPRWGPLKRRTFKGFVGKQGQEREMIVTVEYPEWCSVTVHRILHGTRYAFSEPVYWEEAYARRGRSDLPTEMWLKRVRGQLHKVAKAAALRAAFPEDIGNDYTAEEMEGKDIDAGGVVIEGVAEGRGHAGEAPLRLTGQRDGMNLVSTKYDPPEPAEPNDDPGVSEAQRALMAKLAPPALSVTDMQPKRTWRTMLDDTHGMLSACTAEDEVVAISQLNTVIRALNEGPEQVQREMQALLSEAYQRVMDPHHNVDAYAVADPATAAEAYPVLPEGVA